MDFLNEIGVGLHETVAETFRHTGKAMAMKRNPVKTLFKASMGIGMVQSTQAALNAGASVAGPEMAFFA